MAEARNNAYSCLLDAYLMLTLFVWDIGTKKTKKRTNIKFNT